MKLPVDDVYIFVVKCIRSCINIKQIQTSKKLINLFEKMFPLENEKILCLYAEENLKYWDIIKQ